MSINEILIYQGGLSAVIFSVVLLFSGTNRAANRSLALLILALGFNLIHSLLLNNEIHNEYPLLHILPYGIGFGLGPLLFFYVQLLCSDTRPNQLHLLWFLGDFPHSIYHLLFGREIPHIIFHEVLDKFGFLSMFLLIYYLWRSHLIMRDYQANLPNTLSNIEYQRLSWLKQLAWLFLIFIPLGFVFWILLISTGINFNDKLPVYFFHLIAIFWLGIGGIRQPEIVTRSNSQPKGSEKERLIVSQKHLQVLLSCMEKEKLFLLPDLNVRYLEDRLNLTSRQISDALNQGLNKNFYTFINEYRVDEFKRRLKLSSNLTLLGIALECGFSSKTTFQRVFKEITGLRPTEYIEKSTS